MNRLPAMLHPDQSQIHRHKDCIGGNTSLQIGANNTSDHSLCKIRHSRSVIRLQLGHGGTRFAYINAYSAISIREVIRRQRIEHKTCNMVIRGVDSRNTLFRSVRFARLVGRAWPLPSRLHSTGRLMALCFGSQSQWSGP